MISSEPDRIDARPQAVGTALVIGLEDRRGEQQSAVVVAPAKQAMLGVEPGVAHQALNVGAGIVVDARAVPVASRRFPGAGTAAIASSISARGVGMPERAPQRLARQRRRPRPRRTAPWAATPRTNGDRPGRSRPGSPA